MHSLYTALGVLYASTRLNTVCNYIIVYIQVATKSYYSNGILYSI